MDLDYDMDEQHPNDAVSQRGEKRKDSEEHVSSVKRQRVKEIEDDAWVETQRNVVSVGKALVTNAAVETRRNVVSVGKALVANTAVTQRNAAVETQHNGVSVGQVLVANTDGQALVANSALSRSGYTGYATDTNDLDAPKQHSPSHETLDEDECAEDSSQAPLDVHGLEFASSPLGTHLLQSASSSLSGSGSGSLASGISAEAPVLGPTPLAAPHSPSHETLDNYAEDSSQAPLDVHGLEFASPPLGTHLPESASSLPSRSGSLASDLSTEAPVLGLAPLSPSNTSAPPTSSPSSPSELEPQPEPPSPSEISAPHSPSLPPNPSPEVPVREPTPVAPSGTESRREIDESGVLQENVNGIEDSTSLRSDASDWEDIEDELAQSICHSHDDSLMADVDRVSLPVTSGLSNLVIHLALPQSIPVDLVQLIDDDDALRSASLEPEFMDEQGLQTGPPPVAIFSELPSGGIRFALPRNTPVELPKVLDHDDVDSLMANVQSMSALRSLMDEQGLQTGPPPAAMFSELSSSGIRFALPRNTPVELAEVLDRDVDSVMANVQSMSALRSLMDEQGLQTGPPPAAIFSELPSGGIRFALPQNTPIPVELRDARDHDVDSSMVNAESIPALQVIRLALPQNITVELVNTDQKLVDNQQQPYLDNQQQPYYQQSHSHESTESAHIDADSLMEDAENECVHDADSLMEDAESISLSTAARLSNLGMELAVPQNAPELDGNDQQSLFQQSPSQEDRPALYDALKKLTANTENISIPPTAAARPPNIGIRLALPQNMLVKLVPRVECINDADSFMSNARNISITDNLMADEEIISIPTAQPPDTGIRLALPQNIIVELVDSVQHVELIHCDENPTAVYSQPSSTHSENVDHYQRSQLRESNSQLLGDADSLMADVEAVLPARHMERWEVKDTVIPEQFEKGYQPAVTAGIVLQHHNHNGISLPHDTYMSSAGHANYVDMHPNPWLNLNPSVSADNEVISPPIRETTRVVVEHGYINPWHQDGQMKGSTSLQRWIDSVRQSANSYCESMPDNVSLASWIDATERRPVTNMLVGAPPIFSSMIQSDSDLTKQPMSQAERRTPPITSPPYFEPSFPATSENSSYIYVRRTEDVEVAAAPAPPSGHLDSTLPDMHADQRPPRPPFNSYATKGPPSFLGSSSGRPIKIALPTVTSVSLETTDRRPPFLGPGPGSPIKMALPKTTPLHLESPLSQTPEHLPIAQAGVLIDENPGGGIRLPLPCIQQQALGNNDDRPQTIYVNARPPPGSHSSNGLRLSRPSRLRHHSEALDDLVNYSGQGNISEAEQADDESEESDDGMEVQANFSAIPRDFENEEHINEERVNGRDIPPLASFRDIRLDRPATLRDIMDLQPAHQNCRRGGRGDQASSSSSDVEDSRTRRNRKKPRENILHKNVRKFAAKLMKRTSLPGQSMKHVQITSVSLARMQTYFNSQNSADGPSADRFELSLDQTVIKHHKISSRLWNAQATVIFAESYLQFHPTADRDDVEDAFKTHIITLAAHFRYPFRDEAEVEEEKVTASEEQRKRSRRDRRSYIGQVIPNLGEFKTVLTKLPVLACSGDELDPDSGDFLITTLAWRNKIIRQWMEVLDRLHLSLRFPDNKHATTGSFPHHRLDPRQRPQPRTIADRHGEKAPRGLPLNFYDEEWLASLTALERALLKIKPSINLAFDECVSDMAKRAANIKGPRTPPEPRSDRYNNTT